MNGLKGDMRLLPQRETIGPNPAYGGFGQRVP